MLGSSPRVLESADDLRRAVVHTNENGISQANGRVSVYDSAGLCFSVGGRECDSTLCLSGPYSFEDLRAAVEAHYIDWLSREHNSGHADWWDYAAHAAERATVFEDLVSVCRHF
jgi:hypothetical protein